MRKLGFLITSILAVAVLIIIGAPLLFGIVLQKKYPEMIEHLSDNSGFKLELTDYHRSWFSSTAKLNVVIYNQAPNQKNPFQLNKQPLTQFVINQTIYHGPVAFVNGQNGRKLYFTRAIVKNFVNQNHLEMNGLSDWTYSNQLTSTIELPVFLANNQNQRILIKNLQGNINYTINSHQLTGLLLANNIQVWKPNFSQQIAPFSQLLRLENAKLSFDNQRQENGLWYGKSELLIPSIDLFPNQNNTAKIAGFKISVNQNLINPEKTGIYITSHANQAASSQFDLHNLNLSLNLDVNNKALVNVNKDLQENKLVYSQMIELLTGGINLNLDPMSFITADGLVKLQANLSFPPQVQKTADPMFLLQAYRKLEAKINMQFPQTAVSKWITNFYQKKLGNSNTGLDLKTAAKQQVTYWLDKNILKTEGNNYIMQIDLRGGHLLINGEVPKTNNYFLNLNTLLDEQNLSEKETASSG